MQRNALYTVIFATIVCIACAIVVSSAAVSLKGRQDTNVELDKQRNVLAAAGMIDPKEKIERAEIQELFSRFRPVVIDLATGEENPNFDPEGFDQRKVAADPQTSEPAPENAARVQRVPDQALVYELRDETGELQMVILPVQGYGLWSTLYGFLALESDLDTVRGITFYQHGETPGLGGEVDNPKWKSRWPGRQVYGDDGEPKIMVIKGPAGPPQEDPYHVDGLSGATLTSRGITNLLHFWLSEEIFGPYLRRLEGRSAA